MATKDPGELNCQINHFGYWSKELTFIFTSLPSVGIWEHLVSAYISKIKWKELSSSQKIERNIDF